MQEEQLPISLLLRENRRLLAENAQLQREVAELQAKLARQETIDTPVEYSSEIPVTPESASFLFSLSHGSLPPRSCFGRAPRALTLRAEAALLANLPYSCLATTPLAARPAGKPLRVWLPALTPSGVLSAALFFRPVFPHHHGTLWTFTTVRVSASVVPTQAPHGRYRAGLVMFPRAEYARSLTRWAVQLQRSNRWRRGPGRGSSGA